MEPFYESFPKQFTVGVLNATLDLAALVLVGVVGFLGSEVVLSPVVSGCLPSFGGGCWLVWWASWAQKWSCFPKQFIVGVLNATLDLAALVLVGVVGFLGSEVVLSPVVSRCLRLSPFMWGVGVGWCGGLLGLRSGLVSPNSLLLGFLMQL